MVKNFRFRMPVAGAVMMLMIGGVANAQTALDLTGNAISIWLRAEPATLAGRISNTDSRPLLKGKDAAAVLTDLAEQRYPVYAGADLIVDTDGLTTDAAVKKVSAAMHHYLETIRTNEPS